MASISSSLVAGASSQVAVARALQSEPAVPTMAFGKAEWGEHFGDIGVEPPLPPNSEEILNSPCPFWPGKKVRETHLLTLIPATVNGSPLTLNSLGELIKAPKAGHKTEYRYHNDYVKKELGDQSTSSHWALMTRDVVPESRNKNNAAQKKLIASYAQKSGQPYVLPKALDAAVSILMEHVSTGKRLYKDSPWTYTRCQESVNEDQWPVAIGGFAAGGLVVIYDGRWDVDDVGVGGFRKF